MLSKFCVGVLVVLAVSLSSAALTAAEIGIVERVPVDTYTPPESNRLKFNFDQDWKFIKAGEIKGAKPEVVDFDDSKWADVSLPHTFNDVDTFREKERLPKGEKEIRQWSGVVWYRKHFTLDAGWQGRKVFLEFEGIRNSGTFFVNGKPVGTHTNQVGPCGLDVSDVVKFGGDNVIAVEVDNNMLAKDPKGFSYDWSAQAFYPNYGGLFKDASLHITDKLHQTLPLYSNLKTTGVYVYAENIDTAKCTANIACESEVANETGAAQTLALDAWIVDHDGKTVLKYSSIGTAIPAGAKATIKFSAPMAGIHLWSPDYPYVYRYFTALNVNGKQTDIVENPLGVRKLTFSGTNGLKVNGHPIYLKGYAPRTMMEWAVSGIPQDWMTEYDYKLMKENHAYFIRPMHVAARKNQIESADRFGIVMVVPAGNGEGDTRAGAEGDARWEDRLEVMRDVQIYFRNNPSVWFWEGSNSGISLKHAEDMLAVRNQWDPHGGRYNGNRGTDEATERVREYGSPMDVPRVSANVPHWDAEYARTECPRRVWDKYTPFLDYAGKSIVGGLIKVASPDHAGGGGNGIFEYPADAFRVNSSEDLALNLTFKYWDRYQYSAMVEPANVRAQKGVMVGGAKIFFADSNSDGRLRDMEVARTTGTVDATRVIKESYYALQVCQNPNPQVYVLGHWNYADGFSKTVNVVANTAKVKLVLSDENGNVIKDYGFGDHPPSSKDRFNPYHFAFKDVAWKAGKIEAIGFAADGKEVARHAKTTAGPAVALKLTPVVGPGEWRADGADIVLVDVEAVDAKGQRCPTDEYRVDFKHEGNGVFMGGYNSGIRYSTWLDHINIEAGINRVLVRATRTAGEFTLTASVAKPAGDFLSAAKWDAIKPATLTLKSVEFKVKNGLGTVYPRRYDYVLGPEPTPVADDGMLLAGRPARPGMPVASTAPAGDKAAVMREFNYTGSKGADQKPALPDAHIEHNVKNGAQIYVDRDWKFEKLPKYLEGGDWVQAFQRDATENTSTDTIQFFTNKPAYIYILVDAANKMPVFNNNEDYKWTKENETLTINGRKHDIYKSRALPEAYNGYFAANGKGIDLARDCNQYVVIAVAAP